MECHNHPDRQSNFKFLRSSLRAGAVIACLGVLVACTSTSSTLGLAPIGNTQPAKTNYALAYASIEDSEIVLPAFDYTKMRERYLRQEVKYRGSEKPGSIVVDTTGPFLYFVMNGGRAMRYGIAVGKEGFEWDGDTVVNSKQKWPTWTPPAEMIARKPSLEEFKEGMPAGINNPLGARAMYLFKDGRDTMYRIHGTNRPFSIGKNASSGCFRMINQDVLDLYARVTPGTKVKVRHGLPEHEGV